MVDGQLVSGAMNVLKARALLRHCANLNLSAEAALTRRIDILLAVSCILCGCMSTLPPARTRTPAPGTSFRDCSNGCPEMVVVPQGRFTMGAPAGEEARENLPIERRGRSVPQHLI